MCNFRVVIVSIPKSWLGPASQVYSKGKQLGKLDDGWPESVEEQGLLSLVWRRNFRNDI